MSSVLTSWKEIGQYLGKGVRTAQRWELEFGLPVRRPTGRSRHAVLAIPEELDAWTHAFTRGPSALVAESLRKEMAALRVETSDLRRRLDLLEKPSPAAGTKREPSDGRHRAPPAAALPGGSLVEIHVQGASSQRERRRDIASQACSKEICSPAVLRRRPPASEKSVVLMERPRQRKQRSKKTQRSA